MACILFFQSPHLIITITAFLIINRSVRPQHVIGLHPVPVVFLITFTSTFVTSHLSLLHFGKIMLFQPASVHSLSRKSVLTYISIILTLVPCHACRHQHSSAKLLLMSSSHLGLCQLSPEGPLSKSRFCRTSLKSRNTLLLRHEHHILVIIQK